MLLRQRTNALPRSLKFSPVPRYFENSASIQELAGRGIILLGNPDLVVRQAKFGYRQPYRSLIWDILVEGMLKGKAGNDQAR